VAIGPRPGSPLGQPLPDVELEAVGGARVRLSSLLGDGPLLLAFMANHCPYVQHIERAFGEVADEYRSRGLTVIAVASNDVAAYPEDGPDGMREQAERAGWSFPSMRDPDHALALAVGAVCTPDLFVYDAERRLVHRGAFDASSPRNGLTLTGADLRAALEAVHDGRPVPAGLTPSLGCGIKWRPGSEPG